MKTLITAVITALAIATVVPGIASAATYNERAQAGANLVADGVRSFAGFTVDSATARCGKPFGSRRSCGYVLIGQYPTGETLFCGGEIQFSRSGRRTIGQLSCNR